jgi:hypothetical protein
LTTGPSKESQCGGIGDHRCKCSISLRMSSSANSSFR